MRTTQQWWEGIKSDPQALEAWLVRQYVGEMAAVNLLSEVLIKHGGETTETEWNDVFKVMLQEAKHARWVKNLLAGRGIPIPTGLEATRKYWEEVVPEVECLDDAAHAAHNAESMRLHRIRAIANETDPQFSDLQDVFKKILPDEEWHEQVFSDLCRTENNSKMDSAHGKGLRALSLVLA